MKRRIVGPLEVSEPREKLSSLGSIVAGSEAAGERERVPTASPRFATSAVSASPSSWLIRVMSEVSHSLLDAKELFLWSFWSPRSHFPFLGLLFAALIWESTFGCTPGIQLRERWRVSFDFRWVSYRILRQKPIIGKRHMTR